MSGKGILGTDLYSFGLVSWKILLDGHSPFDHISLCTTPTPGPKKAKSYGCEYCFDESITSSQDFERTKRLNSTEVQNLKSSKGNELLRLACSTTKSWPQWTSKAFVSFSERDIRDIFASIFSTCLCQNPLDRASSMKNILSLFNPDEKTLM